MRDIVVNSPNWERDGRNWQATLKDGKKITFSIEDEDFWIHVNKKDISPDIKDRMRVQWAKPADVHGNTSYKVVKVISYNGEKLGDPLTSTELDKTLGHHVGNRKKDNELDLFSGLDDKNEEGRR